MPITDTPVHLLQTREVVQGYPWWKCRPWRLG